MDELLNLLGINPSDFDFEQEQEFGDDDEETIVYNTEVLLNEIK